MAQRSVQSLSNARGQILFVLRYAACVFKLPVLDSIRLLNHRIVPAENVSPMTFRVPSSGETNEKIFTVNRAGGTFQVFDDELDACN